MKRFLGPIAALLILWLAGAYAMGQRQGDDKKESDDAVTEARSLVTQLEAQVDLQRTELRSTELSLSHAKALLQILESRQPARQIAALKGEEKILLDRLATFKRQLRNPDDPAIKVTKREIDKIREQIKELQVKYAP